MSSTLSASGALNGYKYSSRYLWACWRTWGERCLEGNWDKLIAFQESSFLSVLQIVCEMSNKLLGEYKAARGTSRQVLVGISCFVDQFLGGAALFEL